MSIYTNPGCADCEIQVSSRRPSIPLSVAITKRALDLLFSVLGLLLFGVFLPFLALAIYVDNPGPIFYRQKRALTLREPSANGRFAFGQFWMLKLRSMRVDAEAMTGPSWPRRTTHA